MATCRRCGNQDVPPKRGICGPCHAQESREYRRRTREAAVAEIAASLAALSEAELAEARQRCNDCGVEKLLDEFHICRTRRPWGRHARCKACVAAYDRRRERNYSEEYRSGIKRRSLFKTKYGITPEQYGEMLEAQGGECAICGKDGGDEHHKRLSVDHDHATGRVRGLLCSNCNRGIGHLGDDTERLRAALAYLSAE